MYFFKWKNRGCEYFYNRSVTKKQTNKLLEKCVFWPPLSEVVRFEKWSIVCLCTDVQKLIPFFYVQAAQTEHYQHQCAQDVLYSTMDLDHRFCLDLRMKHTAVLLCHRLTHSVNKSKFTMIIVWHNQKEFSAHTARDGLILHKSAC